MLHPRNRHQGRYDFDLLIQSCPSLAPFVVLNPYKERSIDFSDPEAVKTLNRALLMHYYGVSDWDIPAGYLCPPIPGRADYIHHVADLLSIGGKVPRGDSIRVLDMGVGANCIYPMIGHCEYGWRFVGGDIDAKAVESAKKIIQANPKLRDAIEIRLQKSPRNIFKGLLGAKERFDVSICNPPFHASLEEAQEGSRRKWKNLGHGRSKKKNFGGQGAELWCPGGEAAFISQMIEESVGFATQVSWFTTLVSKESNLPMILGALKKARAVDHRTIDMAQGQKKSRIVAWTFTSDKVSSKR